MDPSEEINRLRKLLEQREASDTSKSSEKQPKSRKRKSATPAPLPEKKGKKTDDASTSQLQSYDDDDSNSEAIEVVKEGRPEATPYGIGSKATGACLSKTTDFAPEYLSVIQKTDSKSYLISYLDDTRFYLRSGTSVGPVRLFEIESKFSKDKSPLVIIQKSEIMETVREALSTKLSSRVKFYSKNESSETIGCFAELTYNSQNEQCVNALHKNKAVKLPITELDKMSGALTVILKSRSLVKSTEASCNDYIWSLAIVELKLEDCKIEKTFNCLHCDKKYKQKSSLSRHLAVHKVRCQMCGDLFSPWKTKHKCKSKQESSPVTDSNVQLEQRFQTESDFVADYTGIYKEETLTLMKKNWGAIRSSVWVHRFSKVYNIRVKGNDASSIFEDSNIMKMYEEQNTKFKINASLGFILVNRDNNTLRYWHASSNEDRLLDNPVLIESKTDCTSFISNIQSNGLIENAIRNRPDTAWSMHCLTNITFYIYPLQSYTGIGCPVTLSTSTKNNKAIVSADRDSHGQPYTNNLCFFRALSLSRNNKETLEKSTKEYFCQYLQYTNQAENDYNGISIEALPNVERIFQTSINVYEMSANSKDSTACLIYRSQTTYKQKLNLHLEQQHFCWIKNLSLYCKSYKCAYCSKLFKSAAYVRRHSVNCSGSVRYVYPSGEFRLPKTIFQKLSEIGLEVDESRKHYPYFAVFDCESYQDKSSLPKDTRTYHWVGQHKLASVSVSSNIAGFTKPVCFVNDNGSEYDVVSKMMVYLTNLSDICYARLRLRYKDVFKKLEEKEEEALVRESQTSAGNEDGVRKRFSNLTDELHQYLRSLLVFGFNSSKFDIPLIKHHIIKFVITKDQNVDFVAKKGSAYMCIKTSTLQFLDILNFLAPDTSYSNFLKAMEVECPKFFWIHEQFSSLEKLKEKKLPPRKHFDSTLKNFQMSEDEYQLVKDAWKREKMKSLRDLLIYYNNCDVSGFVLALEKQNEIYKSKGLDIKSAISLPGLSIRHMFQLKDSDAPIMMFGSKHQDLHDLVKSNVRGGLSMVFCRQQSVDETYIKPEIFGKLSKVTKSCYGYDITSHYASCLMKPMPTGFFIRRRRENEFKIEKGYKTSEKAIEWMKWMEQKLNITITHALNGGERIVGGRNLPVDGYAKVGDEEIVFQYSGCWFHSHQCHLAPNGKENTVKKNIANKLKTYENLKYLTDLSFTVYHTWECEFDEEKSKKWEVKQFCDQLRITIDDRYKISEKTILKEIQSGELFGMVECDIHTPNQLKSKFSEFQPIVKHAYLTRNDVGDHMKQFCISNNLLKSPQKTLLCSYYAKKILLATPLLRWYLDHGLIVTRIHQVIQYKPVACFQEFVDGVMTDRREGDSNSAKAIQAKSAKLMGNAAYGCCLTNRENHKEISYQLLSSESNMDAIINSPQFRHLDEIDSDVIEIQRTKSVIKLEVPLTVGFFVLDYAKLVILSFYYDFLVQYLPDDSFSLIQSDTDSLYLSLSHATIFSTVPVNKREQFKEHYPEWFAKEYCELHKDDFFETMFSEQEWKPTSCCNKVKLYESRTVGKFHVEWSGSGVIALSSKCYYCTASLNSADKHSSKGISKRHNQLSIDDYNQVLTTQTISKGINKGFRIKGDKIFTYDQLRNGLNYFYGKRIVCINGVTTFPTHL